MCGRQFPTKMQTGARAPGDQSTEYPTNALPTESWPAGTSRCPAGTSGCDHHRPYWHSAATRANAMMPKSSKPVLGGREIVRVAIVQKAPAFMDREASLVRAETLI